MGEGILTMMYLFGITITIILLIIPHFWGRVVLGNQSEYMTKMNHHLGIKSYSVYMLRFIIWEHKPQATWLPVRPQSQWRQAQAITVYNIIPQENITLYCIDHSLKFFWLHHKRTVFIAAMTIQISSMIAIWLSEHCDSPTTVGYRYNQIWFRNIWLTNLGNARGVQMSHLGITFVISRCGGLFWRMIIDHCSQPISDSFSKLGQISQFLTNLRQDMSFLWDLRSHLSIPGHNYFLGLIIFGN